MTMLTEDIASRIENAADLVGDIEVFPSVGSGAVRRQSSKIKGMLKDIATTVRRHKINEDHSHQEQLANMTLVTIRQLAGRIRESRTIGQAHGLSAMILSVTNDYEKSCGLIDAADKKGA